MSYSAVSTSDPQSEQGGGHHAVVERKWLIQMGLAYRCASKARKSELLDELCELTGWHRSHGRRVLGQRRVELETSSPRATHYGPQVIAGLRSCWTLLDYPSGKRLAPFLPVLVERLRALELLSLDNESAALLASMSAATIDRRLAADRAETHERETRLIPRRPAGSSLTVYEWLPQNRDRVGFIDIRVTARQVGEGEPGVSVIVGRDMSTGWCEVRAFRGNDSDTTSRTLRRLLAAFPFGIRALRYSSGPEYMEQTLDELCLQNRITYVRSDNVGNPYEECAPFDRALDSIIPDYVCVNRDEDMRRLNQMWILYAQIFNYFQPQQFLATKFSRDGHSVKKYDLAATPCQRAIRDPSWHTASKQNCYEKFLSINPVLTKQNISEISLRLRATVPLAREDRFSVGAEARLRIS